MTPSLEIIEADILDRATFHLVQAKVDWGSGEASDGWGRDASRDIAIRINWEDNTLGDDLVVLGINDDTG